MTTRGQQKSANQVRAAVILASLLVVSGASGQAVAVTCPVGYDTITVPAGSSVPVGLPLVGPDSASFQITEASGNSVSYDKSIDLEIDFGIDLKGDGYYAEFIDGPSAGLTLNIEAFDQKTISFERPVGELLSGTEAMIIRRGATLASAVGTLENSPLQAGPDSASADSITLWNATTQSATTFFLKSKVGWVKVDAEEQGDQSDTRIPYPQAFVITRNAPTDLQLINVGHVPCNPLQVIVPVWQGRNLLAPPLVGETTLSAYSLYEDGSLFSVTAGDSAPESDTLTITQGSTGETSDLVYYRSGQGWRTVGIDGDAAETPVPFGSAAIDLTRVGPDGYILMRRIEIAPQVEGPPVKEVQTSVRRLGNQTIQLSWESEHGRIYRVQQQAPGAPWKDRGNPVTAVGKTTKLKITVSGNGKLRVVEIP